MVHTIRSRWRSTRRVRQDSSELMSSRNEKKGEPQDPPSHYGGGAARIVFALMARAIRDWTLSLERRETQDDNSRKPVKKKR